MTKNKNYRKGYEKERKIVNEARERGCLAFRSAGSHSPIDVFILNPTLKKIDLIQCKPSNISENKKKEIENEIKKFQGLFEVEAWVE